MYNKRATIINAFVNKFIYSGDAEEDMYYNTEGLKPEFEESVAERTKMRKQKNLMINTLQTCLN